MDAMRDAIVTEAREWIGTPWHHQQSTKDIGCDCIGLISGVARNLGFASARAFQGDTRFRGYGKTPDETTLRAAVAEYLDTIPLKDAQPGDIVMMNHERQVQPHHFAILSGPDYMIHALVTAKEVVEHRIDDTWRRRVVAAFKYREVA